MDGEGFVLHADINVFFVNARDFHLQGDVVLVFVERPPVVQSWWLTLLRALGALRLTEKTIHAVL